MKKIISSLLLLAVSSASIPSFAQEKTEKPGVTTIVQNLSPEVPKTEKDVGAALSPMRKGQISPFTGVLISPLAIATLIAELKMKDEEIKIEVDRAKKEIEANTTYEKNVLQNQCVADKKILQADIDGKKAQLVSYDKAIKAEIDSRPNPATWAFIGLAVGVVAATATASIIVVASNN